MPKSSRACDEMCLCLSITVPPEWCVSEFEHLSSFLQCRQQVHCGFGKSSCLKSHCLEKHFLEMSSCQGPQWKSVSPYLQNRYAFVSLLLPKWLSQSLTVAAVLFCFLLVVLDEHLCLSASHLTALRQLVQNLYCACVHFKLRHRLLPKHLLEPLAHLQLHSICRCTVNATYKRFESQDSIFTGIKPSCLCQNIMVRW